MRAGMSTLELREDDEPPFRPGEVWSRLGIEVFVENRTTGTGVGGRARRLGDRWETLGAGAGDESAIVRVGELGSAALSLDAPARSAAYGHVLDVHLQARSGDRAAARAQVRARVTGVTPLEDGRERIDLALTEAQTDAGAGYGDLLRLYAARQGEIDDFMRRARG